MTLRPEKRLVIAFSVTVLILCAEVIGGILSNSLALLSDAGHVATDAFALGLSMIAARISRRPSDERATYGYQRVGILAAVINGVSLLGIALFIFIESYQRFLSPPSIDIAVMIPVALAGLAGNLAMAFILGHRHEDLNIRSAWLHVLGDTLSSVGVLVSGAVLYFTGWVYADPLASVFIGLVIITGGIRVVREALHIFLDLVPRGFDVEMIARQISSLPDVLGIHDVHIRSLAHRRIAFSAHIRVHDQKLSDLEPLRRKIVSMLKEIRVSHILLQFECAECATEGLYCQLHEEEGHHHI